MTWHDEISLEVAVEFARLAPQPFDRVVQALWAASFIDYQDQGSDWRRLISRGFSNEYIRARVARLKQLVVAVRWCVACNKPFDVTAYRDARGRDRVCSTKCRGAARHNIKYVEIGGVRKPLIRWAEEYDLPLKTVWARIKRGWIVARALQTPLANRGQHKRAA